MQVTHLHISNSKPLQDEEDTYDVWSPSTDKNQSQNCKVIRCNPITLVSNQ